MIQDCVFCTFEIAGTFSHETEGQHEGHLQRVLRRKYIPLGVDGIKPGKLKTVLESINV